MGRLRAEQYHASSLCTCVHLPKPALTQTRARAQDPGFEVAKAVAQQDYYLKAFFLTVAPAYESFAATLGRRATEHVLTAVQWHPASKFADQFFGTAQQYSEDYARQWNQMPSYVSAGASAAAYSLVRAACLRTHTHTHAHISSYTHLHTRTAAWPRHACQPGAHIHMHSHTRERARMRTCTHEITRTRIAVWPNACSPA